ncbi:hypothetical protein [Psychromonas sp. Urea-02u-13]|uniref:hypothetical protein n=1 Tax=Psychromonas sp. Urea-02u-13 TaxID=2058326 RepID=UPI000C31F4A4|nr:hypothetical protein [Psychromonas sp. Urea-02u-13]PKG37130.1 hypothetical protein CXF74_20470 [Psychromonas sp. Urea-02u-13]
MVKLPSETLEVLKGVASLNALYNDNVQPRAKVFLYDGTPDQWTNSYAEVQAIYADKLVIVTERSAKEGRGVFSIGTHKNWHYSHSLFATPDELENKIYSLLRFSLTGNAGLTSKKYLEEAITA